MATNFDRWQIYMQNCTSPQTWIDFGFYFLINAALQRRIWLYGAGDDGSELFPNPYYCFVGRPGLGKGLVTRPVSKLLRHHKMEIGSLIRTNIGTEKRPIFPTGPDSVTFEQLLDIVADCVRPIMRPGMAKPYIHSSLYFVLEELDSLFKRKTIDVCAFLKNAYDCGNFSYETRHQAKHQLRNLCLALLAGTQPDFFMAAQKQGLFGEGFASRTVFLFENEKRFSRFHNTELSPEQKEVEAELLIWLKRLSGLYGPISYSPETHDMLEDWDKTHSRKELEAPARMQEYLSRKKVNMLKLAMALHFADSLEMLLPASVFIRADSILTALEPNMAKGFGCSGANPEYQYQVKILDFLRSKGAATEREIIIAFVRDVSPINIRNILTTLLELNQIKQFQQKGQTTYAAQRATD